ncbi:MAG TPA: 23S rRNA (adenine(2503)-C(2))-methyltransferase RlmN [bacterium]
MTDGALPDLKKLSREELVALLGELGQPPWQADEVRRFLYAKGVTEIGGLTSLPRRVREELAARSTIGAPEVVDRLAAPDGTVKLLLRFADGAACETVLMPEPARVTQCLSSQAGCPLACAFCRTGALGLTRSLHWSEIVDQWLAGRRALPRGRRVTNLVFMGMGEPLLNRAGLEEALRFLISAEGGGIAAGKVTVSTAGIVPGIDWLGKTLPQVKLAVSLNAPEDALRSRLMPVNRNYPLRELIAALRRYPTGRRPITIEYVLLGGVNDSPALAARLAHLLRGLRCTVNLIPFNPHSGLPFAAPAEAAVHAFQARLRGAGCAAFIRRSRGGEIGAACGQLGGG